MSPTPYDGAPISATTLEREAEAAAPVPMHLRPGAPQRRVVCAANRLRETGYLALGARHFDPLMRAHIAVHVGGSHIQRHAWRNAEQGFIDQWGTWMDRREAFQVAKAAGQLLYGPHLGGGELDSSDLY